MSMYEPQNPFDQEVIDALAELVDMGFVEIVGINPDGHWLYAATEEGKKAARNWTD